MALTDVRTFELEQSSLDELRQLVAAMQDWPGDAEVRIKGRIEFDMRGVRVAEVRVTAPMGSGAP